MKILFLNYEYPPLGGGAGVATEALLSEFSKMEEIEVHLVTSAVGETLEHLRIGGNVFVHRLPIGKNPKRLHSQSLRDILVYSSKAFFFLKHLVRNEKKPFDVTLAFFTIPCGFLAYLVKLRFGIPYAISLRGADVPGFSEKYDSFYLFLKPLVRFLWKKAKVVIPNSRGLQRLAERTSPHQNMHIIENGIDTELFTLLPEKKSQAEFTFLSVSRLTKRKGIDTLLRAFAVAEKREGSPIVLELIGDGEERAALENLAQELGVSAKVRFLGRVEHRELPSFYQKAGAFVLPSKNEGMSNAVLEALASGLPLVVSGTGGMQELVTEGENGFFVDPDDTKAFAETLMRLAEEPKLALSFGKKSRSLALQRSWEKVAEKFLHTLAS